MHWFKRNIGDYHKKAGRLTMLQHGAYTLLMDACYDREQFPTKEQAIDWVWASTPEEIQAVEFVLSKFFTLEGGIFVQYRIKEELSGYQAKAETNKRIALEREAKRRRDSTSQHEPCTVGEQVDNESTPNQEPITRNQKPEINNRFSEFWDLYGKKTGKEKCEAKFKKLSKSDIEKIFEVLPEYIKSTPDKQYRKNPLTWLNGKHWEDEINSVKNKEDPQPVFEPVDQEAQLQETLKLMESLGND